MKTIHTLSLSCLTFAASMANATMVAEYLFDGGSPADTANDPAVTTSNFATTYAASSGFSSSSSNAFTFVNVIDQTIASSISSGEYFTFSVDPDGGSLSFGSLDFSQIMINAKIATSGTYSTIAVFSSATGFADGDELASFTLTDTAAGTYEEQRNISLAGVSALQNVTTETEFRFYFATDYDYSPNAQTNGNIRLDNVILSTIPEPSTYALALGLVAGMGIMLRRRKITASHVSK